MVGTEYVGGNFSVPAGPHHLGHTDPASKYIASMYGSADRESYSHPLGLLLRKINPVREGGGEKNGRWVK